MFDFAEFVVARHLWTCDEFRRWTVTVVLMPTSAAPDFLHHHSAEREVKKTSHLTADSKVIKRDCIVFYSGEKMEDD